MKKNTRSVAELINDFSALNDTDINNALKIIAQISNDEQYIRPKSIEVAAILFDLKVDNTTLIAALLSDPRLIDLISLEQIKMQFGDSISAIVKDINWLNKLSVYSVEMTHKPNQTEILRRMLLSMTQDVRAVLIKLAYRIQRLRQLPRESHEVRRFISQETLDIYAPIANRLGIHSFKWELEDMAFRYLQPVQYRHIAQSLANNRIQREQCIEQFITLLKNTLLDDHITCLCYGRPKHIYSIWKKMQRKKLGIEELYDLLAVRVIVENLSQCYAVLGIVHSLWQYVPKEFDDYIANPKENGYQSLHTVIIDELGNRIEVQIRTQEMHDYAEMGVAAHWSYKEGNKQNAAVEKSVAMLRRLLDEKNNNDEVLSEDFRSELFNDRVYILTPKGQLIDLAKGATPLDFAYAVHTEIGHRCRGAKVNDKIVPLSYTLKSGERVEIITTKQNSEPNRNWLDSNLGYLKTARAISKVKAWFRGQKQAQNIELGLNLLEKECQRLSIKVPDLKELAQYFKLNDSDILLEFIGRGDINNKQLTAALKVPEFEQIPKVKLKKHLAKSLVFVAGIDNIQTSFANCCTPVLGDEIMGYVSHHKGISVHRADCKNIVQLSVEKRNQLISVQWANAEKASHAVPIIIQAFNAQNILNDVTKLLTQAKIHIFSAQLNTQPDFSASLNLTLQIENTSQLSAVLNRICQLPNVIEAKRVI